MMKLLTLLFLIGTGPNAHAINLLRVSCTHQEVQADRTFITEIHFKKPNTLQYRITREAIEGELLNYILVGNTRKFLSGLNFFNVTRTNGIISGMSGLASNRAEGSFTLSPLERTINGKWHFSYTGLSHTTLEADFKCTYHLIKRTGELPGTGFDPRRTNGRDRSLDPLPPSRPRS